MINKLFEQQLSLSLQRLEDLWRRADQLPNHSAPLWQTAEENPEAPKQLLMESLTELTNSLKELQVVVEELHQQNHKLNTSRLALEAERRHYQELFEFAPDGYLVTTPDGAILEVNQMAGELLNVSQKRLVGKPLVIFINAEERRNFYSKLNQLQNGELIKNWQVQMQRRRGACFIASIAVTPIQNPQGKVEKLRWRILELTQPSAIELILPQNVNKTDGKKPHQDTASVDNEHTPTGIIAAEIQPQTIELIKLSNAELLPTSIPQLETSPGLLIVTVEQLENVLNNFVSGTWDFLFICDRTEKYIYVNQAVASAWGLQQSDFMGKSWEFLKLSDEMVARLEAQQSAVFCTGRAFTDEISLITKKGRIDYEYTMTKISNSTSRLDAVVVMFRNLTSSTNTKTAPKVNSNLEKSAELSNFKFRFSSVLAQELPVALNNILATIKLRENHIQQEVDAKENHYSQTIQVNIRRINQLLDDLLLLKSIESEQIQLKPALIDLTVFCRKLIEELKQDADSQYTITLIIQGRPCGILDEKILRQILTNLLFNAINYSPQNSKIQLSVACQGKQVIFCIQNSGNGINKKAEQELLFHAFSDKINIGETETNKLRLLIIQHCVEIQKGNFSLEKTEDNGTIITVILPMNQRAEKKK